MAKKNAKEQQGAFGKQCITPVGRLLFPALTVPKGYQDTNVKFSAMVIVKPCPELETLQQEILQLGVKVFGPTFASHPDGFYQPIKTGEEIMEKSDKAKPEMYAGRFRILAKSNPDKEPPKCYLSDRTQLPRRPGNQADLRSIEEQFYPGAYVRMAVNPFTFQTPIMKGVGLILKGVQFMRDGERLGSPDLDEAFGAEASDFGDEPESMPSDLGMLEDVNV